MANRKKIILTMKGSQVKSRYCLVIPPIPPLHFSEIKVSAFSILVATTDFLNKRNLCF